MGGARRNGVILVEPEINPVTRRFGLPLVANYPPLAQARLAAQIGGEDVAIADLRVPGETERLLSRIRRDPPALVAISVTFTSNGDEAIGVAAAVRKAAPSTTIVLGGTTPSEDPRSFLSSQADLIGFRAGDHALPALVTEIRRTGRPPARFPGFFHRESDRWVLEPGPPPPALGGLRPYAWHLIQERYWKTYFQGLRPIGMSQTSEGCPYDCTFCSVWKTHGRRVALASLANVQHDFNSLPGFVRGFFFADDIWMQASEAQIRELYDPLFRWMVDEYRPRRPDFWLTAETRTDLYLREEDRFRLWIRRGGLRWIFFGVEAVTDEQLRTFSKRNTVDTNSEALRRATEAGAYVTAQFVIPPEADRAYFDDLVRFIRAHRACIRAANFTIATPLPGTELYNQVVRDQPDLADRNVVAHPAFSLYTALTPTRLDPRGFYEQVARVFREANQVAFRPAIIKQGLLTLTHSPWLVPRLTRIPRGLKRLTEADTFLQVHLQVQGRRLLGPEAMAV